MDEVEHTGVIAKRSDVAALFVDRNGIYPRLVRDWWDAARDACTYSSPLPVVAHPPCGPWGRLRHLSQNDAADLAVQAVALVRRYGGVLEHPAGSKLFDYCDLPRPGELPDRYDGVTIEVSQCDFGHPARKMTWLYCVRCDFSKVGFPEPREPTHWCSGGRTKRPGMGATVPPGIKVCSAQQRRRTPVAFAEWLLELAATAGKQGAA